MSNPLTNFGGICQIWKCVITSFKRRYNAFLFRVKMPFGKALIRLSTLHYYAFLKGVITPFLFALLRLSKRRYYAFLCLKGVILIPSPPLPLFILVLQQFQFKLCSFSTFSWENPDIFKFNRQQLIIRKDICNLENHGRSDMSSRSVQFWVSLKIKEGVD